MKIHAICLVKNEGDIIGLTLQSALNWADHVYVFDTGSSDNTWEQVLAIGCSDARIIPHRNESVPFDDSLRSGVFKAFRENASEGDWWCRLDGDEIYEDSPKVFLPQVPRCHHVVYGAHFQYYLTDLDLPRFPDTTHPVPMNSTNLPRHYSLNFTEPRFFRHRHRLSWEKGAWPRHMGLIHPGRIRIRHYQYRSPGQIQIRLDTRRSAAANGWSHFPNSMDPDWRFKIVPSVELDHEGEGGLPLTQNAPHLPSFLESTTHRILKRVLHGTRLWP